MGVLCSSDLVGCLGGEEFVMVMGCIILEMVIEVVECLCMVVVEMDESFLIGLLMIVSMGMMVCCLGDMVLEMFKCVDLVLYCVKESGCNWYVVG